MGAFWRQQMFDYFDTIPLLGELEKEYFSEKNIPAMDLIPSDEILAELKHYKTGGITHHRGLVP